MHGWSDGEVSVSIFRSLVVSVVQWWMALAIGSKWPSSKGSIIWYGDGGVKIYPWLDFL